MDSDNSKIKRITRERTKRTQITKKRSIPLSLVTVTVNDKIFFRALWATLLPETSSVK
jgi:hypothetical protein